MNRKYRPLAIKIFIYTFFIPLFYSCQNNFSENPRSRLEKLINDKNLNEKKLNEALKLADNLILKNKNDGSLYFSKGALELYLTNFSQADSCFKKAYQLNFRRDACIKMLEDVHLMMKYATPKYSKKDTVLF